MWVFFGYLSKKRSLSTSLTPRNIGIYDRYLRHLLSQAIAATLWQATKLSDATLA